MDPSLGSPDAGQGRFPRPRGDGPLQSKTSCYPMGFPRPRGDGPNRRLWPPRGFPAHAGMGDPHGFPRPRGDGPEAHAAPPERRAVSPPTRGWTQLARHEDDADLGFPAHAGMDPPIPSTALPLLGFPRPRGDGPYRPNRPRRDDRVSPPTRGWTLDISGSPVTGQGFPAHAGMDPHMTSFPRSKRWFPRPRGDGPSGSVHLCCWLPVSPPTRGWT